MMAVAKPVYAADSVPFSAGGYRCDSCGEVIGLDNLQGYYAGTLFQVKGYLCPACHYISVRPAVDRGTVPFSWRRLPVSRVPIRNMPIEGT